MSNKFIKILSIFIILSVLCTLFACNDSDIIESITQGDSDIVTELEEPTQGDSFEESVENSESDESEGSSAEDSTSSETLESDTTESDASESDVNTNVETESANETTDETSSEDSESVSANTTETESIFESESITVTETEPVVESESEPESESDIVTGGNGTTELETTDETEPEIVGTGELVLSIFADFHYEQDVYRSTIADFNAILDRAHANGANVVLQMGDLCNDFVGSPEFLNAYLNNKYNMPVYGVYGNHDLQTAGNSMDIVTPQLTNREVKWGTEDGKIGDGYIGYYYTDVNGFRIIAVDSNYYYDTNASEWKHNPDGSYRIPSGGSCEAALGPVQLAWLEKVVLDAAEKDLPCIVMAHHTFNGTWSGKSYDWQAVQEIYRKANNINPGTVILSMNGHNHTNRQAVVEGVVYLDVNIVYNGIVLEDINQPNERYTTETFKFIRYDEDGNPVGEETDRLISELAMAPYVYFFEDPLSAIITVTDDGKVKVEGMNTEWLNGIVPENTFSYKVPEISSFEYDPTSSDVKNGVEVLYPAHSIGNNCEYVKTIGGFEVMNENGVEFVRIYGGNSQFSYNKLDIYSNDGTAVSGQYLIFKYRIPSDKALNQSTLYMYAGTVNKTATGEQENIAIKVSEDGEWHIAVVDLASLVGNASGSLFNPADDGKYYAKYIQMRPVTEYNAGYKPGTLEDYMDIAYFAICDDLAELKTIIDPDADPIYDKYTSKTDYTQLKSADNSCAVCGVVEVTEGEKYIYKCISCNTVYSEKSVPADINKYYSASAVNTEVKTWWKVSYKGLYIDEDTGVAYTAYKGADTTGQMIYTRYPYEAGGKYMGPDKSYSVGKSNYLALKLRVSNPQQSLNVYIGSLAANTVNTEDATGNSGVASIVIPLKEFEAETWVTYVIDLNEVVEGSWKADDDGNYTVQTLYLHLEGFASTTELDVAYIAFCEGDEELNALVENDVSRKAFISSASGSFEK